MNYPVYTFAKDEAITTMEIMLQEMCDGWWGKPFYFGAGLVIDFKGGLVRKLVQDAHANPGNAERLYLSDIMSGRVTPYNPILTMCNVQKDEQVAGYVVDMLVSVTERPVSETVKKVLRGAIATGMKRCRETGEVYDLIKVGQIVAQFFDKKGYPEESSCVRSMFYPLNLLPYKMILNGQKPGLTTEVILSNKLICVLDASKKRMDDFIVPTRDAGMCKYDQSAVSVLASLLVLDFWQNLIKLYRGARLRYTPLVLMVNGLDLLPPLPYSKIFSDMVDVGAKGLMVLANESVQIPVAELGPDVSVIYTNFPEAINGKRGHAPFEQMNQYTFSVGEMSQQ